MAQASSPLPPIRSRSISPAVSSNPSGGWAGGGRGEAALLLLSPASLSPPPSSPARASPSRAVPFVPCGERLGLLGLAAGSAVASCSSTC